MAAKARLTLDSAKLSRLLRSRDGDVGRIMNAFAGLATTACKEVARERVKTRTGRYLDSIKSTTESFPGGVRVRTESITYGGAPEKATRPHVIRPRRARVLRFETQGGQVVYARQVSHPGTSAKNVLKDGVRRAGHRLNRIAG